MRRQPKMPSDDVEVAVAIEVGGARIGDAGQPLREDDTVVGAVPGPPQPETRAVVVVGGLERAEIGHEQIQQTVLSRSIGSMCAGWPRLASDFSAKFVGARSAAKTGPERMSLATMSSACRRRDRATQSVGDRDGDQ